MKKYFLGGLVFLGVFLCGMAFRALLDRSAEDDLDLHTQRILKEAGVDASSSKYQHLFVALRPDSRSGSDSLTVSHLGGSVWGVNAPKQITDVTVAEFTATLKDRRTVVLEGEVDAKDTVTALELAANKAAGIEVVENNLVVGANVMTPEWRAKAPQYLENFLSQSGVRRFTAEGSGLKLEGEVISNEVLESLGHAANAIVPSPSLVSNELTVREVQAPILIARREGEGISVSGLLPSEKIRNQLVDAVGSAFPNQKIYDEFRIEEAVNDPWWLTNAVNLVPMFFSAIDGDGSIEYWKNHLLVSGQLASEEVATKMVAIASGFGKPEQFSIENDLTVVPDNSPEINLYRDPRGKLVLEGQVASSVFKDQIIGGLMRHNPEVIVQDNLKVSESVQDLRWGDPGVLVKELMFNARDGMLRITSDGIKLAGEAGTSDSKDQILSQASVVIGSHGKIESILTAARGVVANTVAKASVARASTPQGTSVARSAIVGDDLGIDFGSLAVYFNSGRSTIRDSQLSNLRQTARVLRKIDPNLKVIVGGYADHRGNQSFNRRLSLNRANTVRDKLISYGVPADRMVIKHFGEDVSNIRNSDLWKSRRVELSLLKE